MEFRTEGKPAPGRLVIVHGFLNTWSDELGIEDFETTASAAAWLRAANLWKWRRGPTAAETQTLRDFRAAIRQFVLEAQSAESAERLNGFSADVGLRLAFGTKGETALVAHGAGLTFVIGTIASIIYTSMADGTWSRFKCCGLATCGWAFYDNSKNHSGRWCSMKTCGSRHKARAYLKRKALTA